MRNLLLFIVSSPLLVLLLVFDVIKMPIVIFIFLPLSIFDWIIDTIKGCSNFREDVLGFLWEPLTLGVSIYLSIVWDKDLWCK